MAVFPKVDFQFLPVLADFLIAQPDDDYVHPDDEGSEQWAASAAAEVAQVLQEDPTQAVTLLAAAIPESEEPGYIESAATRALGLMHFVRRRGGAGDRRPMVEAERLVDRWPACGHRTS